MTSTSFRTLATVFALAFASAHCASQELSEAEKLEQAETEKILQEPTQPGFWSKMEFNDGRKLTKARVVVTSWPPFGSQEVKKQEIAIEDGTILKLMERAIAESTIPVPKSSGGLAGVMPTKRIELTTNKDKFSIQVFEMSFALADKPLSYDSQREFHSTSLAHLLDALLRKHGTDGLSKRSLSGLSGELSIRLGTEAIKKQIAETPGLQVEQEK